MLRVCICTRVCMNLPGIGQNHYELSQKEIWVVTPRDDLISRLNRVAGVQQNSCECRMNLMLTESFLLILSESCLWVLAPLSPC